MGLDAYLTAEKYISGYSFETADKIKLFDRVLKSLGLTNKDIDNSSPSIVVNISIGYWRKANAIHKWFVDNTQDGVDNCEKSYVEREQLQELLGLCKKVLKNNELAAELLPCQAGFFFGGTEYDDWYFDDLTRTVEILEKILNNKKLEDFEFYYRASW